MKLFCNKKNIRICACISALLILVGIYTYIITNLGNRNLDISNNEINKLTFSELQIGGLPSEPMKELYIETFNKNIDDYVSILSANEDTIVLSNNYNIILLEKFKNEFSAVSLIDLKSLSNTEIENTMEKSISPNSNYIVFSNENEEKKELYFCDLVNNKGALIGSHDKIELIDDWSSNSQFYVYADKQGGDIYIYDVQKNEVERVCFSKDIIKDIYVTDKGSVYIKGNKKHFIDVNNNHSVSEMRITGTLLECRGETLYYYHGGDIFFIENGKTDKLIEIGNEFNLVKNDSINTVFSNESETIVYNYETKALNKYQFKYDDVDYMEFNKEGNKCLIYSERFDAKVIDSTGVEYEIDQPMILEYISKSKWIDNNSLIKVNLDSIDKTFFIEKINIIDNLLSIIFRS